MSSEEGLAPPPACGVGRRYGLAPFATAGGPTFSFEVHLASGEEGAELRATQAWAIKELLAWAHTERQRRTGRRN